MFNCIYRGFYDEGTVETGNASLYLSRDLIEFQMSVIFKSNESSPCNKVYVVICILPFCIEVIFYSTLVLKGVNFLNTLSI